MSKEIHALNGIEISMALMRCEDLLASQDSMILNIDVAVLKAMKHCLFSELKK